METILEALKYLPRYLADMGSVLARPKRFIAERNTKAEETFHQSLMFLFYSVVVVCLLQAAMDPAETNIGVSLVRQALFALVSVSLFAVSLRVAWAAVGGKSRLRSFFVTYAYFTGAISVVWCLVIMVAEGVIRVFEPEVYATATEMKVTATDLILQFDEQDLGSGVLAALVILVAGYLAVATWGLIG